MSVRWSILLYAFSLPFESLDLPFASGMLSLAKVAALLVLISCLIHLRSTFSTPHRAVCCFGAYLIIFYIRGAIASDNLSSTLLVLLTPFQLIFLAWFISKPLRDRKLAASAFAVFAFAATLVAAGMILKLPGFSVSWESKGVDRTSALGNDPNVIGTTLALASAITIGLLLGKRIIKKPAKLLLAFLSVSLPFGILLTGSRTAVAALVCGVGLYLLPIGKVRSVIKTTPVLLFCLTVLFVFLMRDPKVMSRLTSSYQEGDLSGRDVIVAQSLVLFADKPLLGWGPIIWADKLGKDTHNLYLYLLLEVGIIGAIPYFLALLLCIRNIWRSRFLDWGRINLAAFVTLMIANLSVNFRYYKPMWFLIATALSLAVPPNESAQSDVNRHSILQPINR